MGNIYLMVRIQKNQIMLKINLIKYVVTIQNKKNLLLIFFILLNITSFSQDIQEYINMQEYKLVDSIIYKDLYQIILPEYSYYEKSKYDAFFINYHDDVKKFNLTMIYAPISTNLDTSYAGFFYINNIIFIFDKSFKKFTNCLEETNMSNKFIINKINSKNDSILSNIIVDYPLWIMNFKNGRIELLEKYK